MDSGTRLNLLIMLLQFLHSHEPRHARALCPQLFAEAGVVIRPLLNIAGLHHVVQRRDS